MLVAICTISCDSSAFSFLQRLLPTYPYIIHCCKFHSLDNYDFGMKRLKTCIRFILINNFIVFRTGYQAYVTCVPSYHDILLKLVQDLSFTSDENV